MYEKFTDRARKVMHYAQQEAKKLNHYWIGTEHILLGLIREGHGLGAIVLKSLATDLRSLERITLDLLRAGTRPVMLEKCPLTPRAKRVVEAAAIAAETRGDSYVGTEHILLGLLGEPKSIAGKALAAAGVSGTAVLIELDYILERAPALSTSPAAQPEAAEEALAAQKFVERLQYATEIVKTWPSWKQRVLGELVDVLVGDTENPD